MKKSNTVEFIKKSQEIFGDRYSYSKVNYINSLALVIIICKVHGEFLKTPKSHLIGQGCKKCIINHNTLSQQEFEIRSKLVHDNKYSYIKSEYKNTYTKVIIICPTHGEFLQIPKIHLIGSGCDKCKFRHDLNQEEFEERSIKAHGYKYDYSKSIYITSKTKVEIICPTHGSFYQTPELHMNKCGCKKCIKGKNILGTDAFVKKAVLVHGDKYHYSSVNYLGSSLNIEIICKIHGQFLQKPKKHLIGHGCPSCGGRISFTREEIIEKFNLIHNNIYNYSIMNYINKCTNVEIICKIHGSFFQTPRSHLKGASCPKCKVSVSKGEKIIINWLVINNITFTTQYKLSNCKNIRELPFDFYLPNYNLLIEYDGIQHFIEKFGPGTLIPIQKNDGIKTKYCADNKIDLLRIKYTEFKNIEEILDLNILKIIKVNI